jgi:DHA2 family multidrug resistance protein-like MFS transporter
VILIGAGLLAAGLVMVMSLVTEAIVGSVSPERAGSASAVMETCSEFGGALGIAVLGSIGTAAYRADLPANAIAPLREGLPAATAAASHLPTAAADALLAAARQAFTHSLNTISVVGAVLLLATAVVTTLTLRRTSQPTTAPELATADQ